MTLFAEVAAGTGEDEADFVTVLDRFYDGRPDPATLEMLR